jgi:hypothetical protein
MISSFSITSKNYLCARDRAESCAGGMFATADARAVCRIYRREKNFAHNAYKHAARERNRSKSSESGASDSLQRPPSALADEVKSRSSRASEVKIFVTAARLVDVAVVTPGSAKFASPCGEFENQRPSLRFNSSLTACGLALPPEAFIA